MPHLFSDCDECNYFDYVSLDHKINSDYRNDLEICNILRLRLPSELAIVIIKLSKKIYGRIFFKNKALCVSPIKGLSTHMTEGVMTPLIDWELVCKEYIDEMKKIGVW